MKRVFLALAAVCLMSTSAMLQALTISGQVRHVGTTRGIPNVKVGSGGDYVTTGADGRYSMTVPSGWAGTIYAERVGAWYTPSSRSYSAMTQSLVDQDYEGTDGFTFVKNIAAVTSGCMQFVDYDSDGLLDLIESGSEDYDDGWGYSGTFRFTSVLHNEAGSLVNRGECGLPSLYDTRIAYGDYDNDGDLDAVVIGYSTGPYTSLTTSVYRNDGGVFVRADMTIGSCYSSAFGDYDNDGDLDLVADGRIYRNDSGKLVDSGKRYATSAGSWGDYDNDGQLDLLCGGVYHNDGGVFTKVADVKGVQWVDYDTDGDLDIRDSSSMLWRNDAGTFVSSGISVYGDSWGDVDNDGDLDCMGYDKNEPRGHLLYRNDGGTFTLAGLDGSGVGIEALPVGDFDNDGDLDFAISGGWGGGYHIPSRESASIYRNDESSVNTAPSVPGALKAVGVDNSIRFSWNAATDNTTPAVALTYNLRIGKTPGGNEVMSGQSLPSGKLLTPSLGNVQYNRSWTIKGLAPGRYYWSAQAIDNSYAGSAWAPEQSFVITDSGNLKKVFTDAPVCCRNIEMAVTAVFGDSFYAEDVNRMYGIRVDYPGHGLQPGDKVKFSGLVSVDATNGEVFVAAGSVAKTGSLVVRPLALCNRSLGGGQSGIQTGVLGRVRRYDPATKQYMIVWAPSVGMNNIGMLVKTIGKVKSIDPNGCYFYIDDGSGLSDGTSTNGRQNVGVRVEGDGTGYTIGQQVVVTGISSCLKDSYGRTIRYLRVREKTTL